MKIHFRNLPQIVTHILQKAFFKHTLYFSEDSSYNGMEKIRVFLMSLSASGILSFAEMNFQTHSKKGETYYGKV